MRKNNKIIWIIVLFLAASTVLFGISRRDREDNVKEVSLYFLNRDSSAFSVVDKEVEAENDSELYKKLLTETRKMRHQFS